MCVLVAGVMTFGASTHVTKRPRDKLRPCPYQLSSNVLAPGGSTPRIMKTTGQISHTGASDYPDYRGYSQGNGPGEGGRGGHRQGDCAGGGEAAGSRSLRGG